MNENEFIADFPLWVIVFDPLFDDHGYLIVNEKTQFASEQQGDRVIMLVFTDDPQAEQYAEKTYSRGHRVAFDTADATIECTQRLIVLHGVTHVAPDPVAGSKIRLLLTVDEFISAVEATLDSGFEEA